MRERGIAARDHVEDQEREHRDGEQDDQHLADPPDGEPEPSSAPAGSSPAGRTRRGRRRRRRSGRGRSARASRPARSRDAGPDRMWSTPSPIIVPHDGSGGWTPTPRKPRAASSRIAFATISGKKTISVDARFGQDLREHDPHVPRALRARSLDELLLAQGEHLAADRPRHVGHVDDRDDQDRDQLSIALDRDRPEVDARERERGAERDAEQEHGEGPDHVEACVR